MRLHHQPERYSPTGNLASEGALNQLGRPKLDRFNVLVREAVQNSWDAREPGRGSPVTVGFHARQIDDGQLAVLRDQVFAERPSGLDLDELLDGADAVNVLMIADRGTVGLGGPTRADLAPGDEPQNFVNFLRNIGTPPRNPQGMGTFGYGKVALFKTSRARTIYTHSHAFSKGRVVRRFMAAAVGEKYGTRGGQFTGRHWWGIRRGDLVEPVEGIAADELAVSLGLPAFDDGEFGTTIVIIEPDFGERTPEEAMHFIAQCLLWNFWPKMINTRTGSPAMKFEVSWQGHSIEIPEPHLVPPLAGFVRSMEKLKGAIHDPNVSQIACERPRQLLGMLALDRFPFSQQQRMPLVLAEDSSDWPTGHCHHVAIMRQAEFVVKYLPGPALPSEAMEYAGVFIANRDVDAIFARSEPPTHDDWAFSDLENPRERSFVRLALKRIGEALREFTSPQGTGTGSSVDAPLGAFADHLGGLLIGPEGPSGRVQTATSMTSGGTSGTVGGRSGTKGVGPNGPRLSRTKARASIKVTNQHLELIEGQPTLTVTFEVEHARASGWTRVTARTGALLDGSELESDPPIGASVPRVLWWTSPDGRRHIANAIKLEEHNTGPCSVTIALVSDAMLGVTLLAEPGEP